MKSSEAVIMNMTKPSMVRQSLPTLLTLNRPPVRYADMSDVQLVSACKQRDRIAFNWLVKRHERAVFSILYKLAPDYIDPGDLVQDVFLRIWMSIRTLQNPHAFRSWLKRVVTNLFYDKLRKRPMQTNLSLDGLLGVSEGDEGSAKQIVDPAAQPDELYERTETSEAVREAIGHLSPVSRTMIELRENDGFSYFEIAGLTECPLGTVKSRIARARLKLQKLLPSYRESTVIAYPV